MIRLLLGAGLALRPDRPQLGVGLLPQVLRSCPGVWIPAGLIRLLLGLGWL